MTPTERIKQIEKELAELKEQVKQEQGDTVVESGEFFGMAQGYIYPVPGKDSGCPIWMYSLAKKFNESQKKPRMWPAEGPGNKLRIIEVSRHASGRFSVEDTGKVFDPWGEQQAEFKPIGELDLKKGDCAEVKWMTNVMQVDPGATHPFDFQGLGWVAKTTQARKVSP